MAFVFNFESAVIVEHVPARNGNTDSLGGGASIYLSHELAAIKLMYIWRVTCPVKHIKNGFSSYPLAEII